MPDETRTLTRLCIDQDCPDCGWPEMYAEVDFSAEVPGAEATGCRKCGLRIEASAPRRPLPPHLQAIYDDAVETAFRKPPTPEALTDLLDRIDALESDLQAARSAMVAAQNDRHALQNEIRASWEMMALIIDHLSEGHVEITNELIGRAPRRDLVVRCDLHRDVTSITTRDSDGAPRVWRIDV